MTDHEQEMRRQASAIPDEEIVAFLTGGGLRLSDYFLEDRAEYTAICVWHPQNGPMEMLIDDGVLALAALRYLEWHETPLLRSREELEQLAPR